MEDCCQISFFFCGKLKICRRCVYLVHHGQVDSCCLGVSVIRRSRIAVVLAMDIRGSLSKSWEYISNQELLSNLAPDPTMSSLLLALPASSEIYNMLFLSMRYVMRGRMCWVVLDIVTIWYPLYLNIKSTILCYYYSKASFSSCCVSRTLLGFSLDCARCRGFSCLLGFGVVR